MGFDAHIDRIFERPPDEGISLAMVVMQGGEIVAERYGTRPANELHPASPVTPETPLISWSMAKSIAHAAVGILVGDGLLDPAAPAPVPQWQGTEKAAITVLDLLEMRSGLRFVEDYVDGDASHCIDMLFGSGAGDHAAYAAALPLDHEPGTVWNYSSGTSNIVARIIGDAIADRYGSGEDGMRRFLRERLFAPCAMTTASPRFDGAGTWVASSYVDASARDFARFGELYRNGGVTPTGERILPEGWADHARVQVAVDDEATDIPGGLGYGRHWWLWLDFPGSLAAHGYDGQFTIVVPDRELTVVHLGRTDVSVRATLVEGLHALVAGAV